MTFIVVGGALIAMLLLWSAVSGLLRGDPPPISRLTREELGRGVRLLVATSFAFTVLSALVFALVLPDEVDALARGSHALFLLGWWLTLAILSFAVLTMRRLGLTLPPSAIAGFLVALAFLVYFTPLTNYVTVFRVVSYDRAVIIGLALVAMAYTILRRLGRMRPHG